MGTSPTPSPNSAPAAIPKASPAAHLPATAHQAVSPLLLPATRDKAQDARRPSIQFMPHSKAGLHRGSPKRGRAQRRMSSPPPPPLFQPRVSFDTFDRPADFIEENSFTLITKHKDYEYTKRSRTFLCGLDSNDYSEYALEWLIDELVDDGDEIVCLRVVEKDSNIAADPSVEEGRYRRDAEQLMRHIQGKNKDNKAINLILEFSVGKVNKVIDEMINLYEPAILVVGTRGRSLGGFQGLLPGSVSKYCLQHSPVPVIVVRPNSKRIKAKTKRGLDPSRHTYREILEKSAAQGGHVLDLSHRNSLIEEESLPVSEDEAAAVAAEIGYRPLDHSPLTLVQTAPPELEPNSPESTHSGFNGGDSSPEDFRSPGVVMKSPELQNLDSPPLSDASSSDDDVEDTEDDGGVPTNFQLESAHEEESKEESKEKTSE
ncbi:adenine nucleotide alpha hydrolases-like protein [Lepidopterella palustris CBS 459.81]|uniref:Adenine nucleotide alpha hydrolases-like protein n=1 Tax=Lepidopterella palustris CBS 459.81 TaxID=1314670 RepID=A0A8E2EL30_9PEZI|nr:adenine nucleotide alpha hydrolases-like protein [Lepidopterella palustris CBS 459.81]